MKKLIIGLIAVASLTMYSCMCGCGIEDPDKPRSEMSEVGQLLMGTHYLEVIPGTNAYMQNDGGTINLFVRLGEKMVLHTFLTSDVVFEEASDIPYVKFSWIGGNIGQYDLHQILDNHVQEVTIGLAGDMTCESEETTPEQEDKDYVQSLIDGTNTFEE